MADDVVHLPGDPGAFGGRGELGLLVAFDLELLGAFDEGRVVLAGADRDAEERDDRKPTLRDDRLVPTVPG